jgi:hypothetical protein
VTAVGLLAEVQERVLHAGGELRILAEDGAMARDVLADGLGKGAPREPLEQPGEPAGLQGGDRGKEGARGNAVLPLPPGLVVGQGEGVLKLGVEADPEPMQEVLAGLGRVAGGLGRAFTGRAALRETCTCFCAR